MAICKTNQTQALLLAAFLGMSLISEASVQAGGFSFPWHSSTQRQAPTPSTGAPALALSPSAPAPVQMLPPKSQYPYGWFGPTPTHHWYRSFGHQNGYTQWERR